MRDSSDVSKERADRQSTFGSSMPQPMSSDRDAIYESLASLGNAQPAPEVPPKEEPKPEAPPAEVAQETKAEEAPAEVVKPETEKTVPYPALKEERDKRKALQSEVNTLKEQMQQMLEANKKYVEMLEEKQPEAPISDYDAELISSRKKVKSLESEINSMKQEFVEYRKLREQDVAARTQQETDRKAREVDKELATDGFKGFYKHIPQVVFAMDQEGISPEDRTPETWKRIYKSVVYPDVFGDYVPKQDKVTQKEALKAEAAKVVKTSGKPDVEPKKEADWTFDEYVKWQRSQRVS